MSTQVFRPGDAVVDDVGRYGVVQGVRDDAYERKCRQKDPRHGYYYHVQFNDGDFDTYVPGYTLTKTRLQNLSVLNKT